jgi:hypothetical protein
MVKTNSDRKQKKKIGEREPRVLTQEELLRWWPFERLDPKRFPKQTKTNKLEEYEDAPI